MNGTLFVNDNHLEELGGAAATMRAFFEKNGPHDFCLSRDLTDDLVKSHHTIILGNFFTATEKSLGALFGHATGKNLFKIEFDFGFCAYRSPLLKRNLHQNLDPCPHSGNVMLKTLYAFLDMQCRGFLFMSEMQRDIFVKLLEWNIVHENDHRMFVVSSCFDDETWAFIRANKQVIATKPYAVVSASDDFQKYCKGTHDGTVFCHVNQLPYEKIYTPNYHKFLKQLSEFRGLVFMPANFDTCPRLLIEARLLGLMIFTNANSQHVFEDWWRGGEEKMEEYLKSRPSAFWKFIHERSR